MRESEPAIVAALDALLQALEPDAVGQDRFRFGSEPGRFDRIFGGQLVAQALRAAGATADGRDPQSLHAYFVEGGILDQPLDASVERVRDGRTMSTRRVAIMQSDRIALTAIASFHDNPSTPALTEPPPRVPGPDEMPTLQDWARDAPEAIREHVRVWIDTPPPLEVRIGEALTFLGGAQAPGTRSHWLRLPRAVGDDRLLNAVLLTYASDYFLMDMARRNHPTLARGAAYAGSSLDHTVWFHRPVHFERWHCYTQRTLATVGHRSLVQGAIHDEDGDLVATVAQDVLIRAAGA